MGQRRNRPFVHKLSYPVEGLTDAMRITAHQGINVQYDGLDIGTGS